MLLYIYCIYINVGQALWCSFKLVNGNCVSECLFNLRYHKRIWKGFTLTEHLRLPLFPSSCVSCLSFSLFFLVCTAVKTAVKHSLISQGNSNEKIQPTLSLCCRTAHYKCWQETAVLSLTFSRALRTHIYTHPYYWQCLWISRVWDGVEEFNDTQCRFNLSAPWPGDQVHICPLFKGEGGVWVALRMGSADCLTARKWENEEVSGLGNLVQCEGK